MADLAGLDDPLGDVARTIAQADMTARSASNGNGSPLGEIADQIAKIQPDETQPQGNIYTEALKRVRMDQLPEPPPARGGVPGLSMPPAAVPTPRKLPEILAEPAAVERSVAGLDSEALNVRDRISAATAELEARADPRWEQYQNPIARHRIENAYRAKFQLPPLSEPRERPGFAGTMAEEIGRPGGLVSRVPFVGVAAEAVDLLQLKSAATRIEAGKGTGRDWETVAGYLEEVARESRDRTVRGKAAAIVVEALPWAAEWIATGGIIGAVRPAAKRAVKEAGEAVFRTGLSRAVQELIDAGGAAARGTVARTLAAPHRIAAEAIRRRVPEFEVEPADGQALDFVVRTPDEGLLESLGKGVLDTSIEIFSEQTGRPLRIIGGAMAGAPGIRVPVRKLGELKAGLVGSLMAKRGWTLPQAARFLQTAGYDGVLEEIGEERVGEVLRAVTGLQEYRLPSAGQLGAEALAFGVTGGALRAAGAAAGRAEGFKGSRVQEGVEREDQEKEGRGEEEGRPGEEGRGTEVRAGPDGGRADVGGADVSEVVDESKPPPPAALAPPGAVPAERRFEGPRYIVQEREGGEFAVVDQATGGTVQFVRSAVIAEEIAEELNPARAPAAAGAPTPEGAEATKPRAYIGPSVAERLLTIEDDRELVFEALKVRGYQIKKGDPFSYVTEPGGGWRYRIQKLQVHLFNRAAGGAWVKAPRKRMLTVKRFADSIREELRKPLAEEEARKAEQTRDAGKKPAENIPVSIPTQAPGEATVIPAEVVTDEPTRSGPELAPGNMYYQVGEPGGTGVIIYKRKADAVQRARQIMGIGTPQAVLLRPDKWIEINRRVPTAEQLQAEQSRRDPEARTTEPSPRARPETAEEIIGREVEAKRLRTETRKLEDRLRVIYQKYKEIIELPEAAEAGEATFTERLRRGSYVFRDAYRSAANEVKRRLPKNLQRRVQVVSEGHELYRHADGQDVAGEIGTDAMAQAIIDAGQRGRRDYVRQVLEFTRNRDNAGRMTPEELTAIRSYQQLVESTGVEKVSGADLEPGDTVRVAGEELEVREKTKQGVLLKDDSWLEVKDEQELPIEPGSHRSASAEAAEPTQAELRETGEEPLSEQEERSLGEVAFEPGRVVAMPQRARVAREIRLAFGRRGNAILPVIDAYAKQWAIGTGRPADEFFGKLHVAKGGTPGAGALSQIKAYHGTRPEFARFDISKIGSGEGAQVYGWGLYFTSKPEIADWYRRNLARREWEYEGEWVDREGLTRIIRDEFARHEETARFADSAGRQAVGMLESGYGYREVIRQMTSFVKDPEVVENALQHIFSGLDSARADESLDRYFTALPKGARTRSTFSEPETTALYDFDGRLSWISPQKLTPEQALATVRGQYVGSISNNRAKIDELRRREKSGEKLTGFDWDVAHGFPTWETALRLIDQGKLLVRRGRRAGRVYVVNLVPDEHELLDWDKSIDAQPEFVREAIERDTLSRKTIQTWEPEYLRRSPKGGYLRAAQMKGAQFYLHVGDAAQEAIWREKGFERRPPNHHRAASEHLRKLGIRGIKYKGRTSGETNYVIFDDADVVIERMFQRKNGHPAGAYEMAANGDAVIRALQSPDASTLPHEVWHLFFDMLPAANAELYAEAKRAMGIAGEPTVEHKERWARAGEAYLRSGHSPIKGLQRAFEAFKRWLTDIYRSIRGTPLAGAMTPQLRSVFDRMLGAPLREAAPRRVTRTQQAMRVQAPLAASPATTEQEPTGARAPPETVTPIEAIGQLTEQVKILSEAKDAATTEEAKGIFERSIDKAKEQINQAATRIEPEAPSATTGLFGQPVFDVLTGRQGELPIPEGPEPVLPDVEGQMELPEVPGPSRDPLANQTSEELGLEPGKEPKRDALPETGPEEASYTAPAAAASETEPPGVSAEDLPFDLLVRAKQGTSFVPEQRARGRQREYVQRMGEVWAELQKRATTDEQRAIGRQEFERFRTNYLSKYRDLLHRESSQISTMIAGPAKFPVRQQQKKQAGYEKALNEFLAWEKRATKAMLENIRPSPSRSISADRNDAVDQLNAKIADAERRQEAMVKANRIYRSKQSDDEKVKAVAALGFQASEARARLKPDFANRIGFVDYEVRNNAANIKRMAARVAELGRIRGGAARSATFDGGRVEENEANNRIQIFFDAKPDEAMRERLKKRGFKWAPSEGAWQRQRTEAARDAVKSVFGVSLRGDEVEAVPPNPMHAADVVPTADDPDARPSTYTAEELRYIREHPNDPVFGMGAMANIPDVRGWWKQQIDKIKARMEANPSLAPLLRGLMGTRMGMSEAEYEQFRKLPGGEQYARSVLQRALAFSERGEREQKAERAEAERIRAGPVDEYVPPADWTTALSAEMAARLGYWRELEDVFRGDAPYEKLTARQKRIVDIYAPVANEITDFWIANEWAHPYLEAFGFSKDLIQVMKENRAKTRTKRGMAFLRRMYDYKPHYVYNAPRQQRRLTGPSIRGPMFKPRRGDEEFFILDDRTAPPAERYERFPTRDEAGAEMNRRIKAKQKQYGTRVARLIKVLNPFDVDDFESMVLLEENPAYELYQALKSIPGEVWIIEDRARAYTEERRKYAKDPGYSADVHVYTNEKAAQEALAALQVHAVKRYGAAGRDAVRFLSENEVKEARLPTPRPVGSEPEPGILVVRPVRDIEYLMFRTLTDSYHNMNSLKLFKMLDETVAQDSHGPEIDRELGLVHIPKDPVWGPLANRAVPEPTAYAIFEWERVHTGFWNSVWDTWLYAWKSAKVPWSLSTWGRQLQGNMLFWFLDRGQLGILKQTREALKQMREGGPEYERLVKSGKLLVGWGETELRDLEERLKAHGEDLPKAAIDFMVRHPKVFKAGKRAGETIAAANRRMGKWYELPEQVLILASYMHKVHEVGMTHEEAIRNLWMYPNYDELGRAAKWARRAPLGAPFVAFTDQAVKIFARAVRERPVRMLALVSSVPLLNMAARMILGVDDDEMAIVNADPRRRGTWINRFYQPLLPIRDQKGRPLWIDLRWVFPLASDLNIATPAGGMRIPFLFSQPWFTVSQEFIFNRDSYTGRELWPADASMLEKLRTGAKIALGDLAPVPPLLHKSGGGGLWRVAEAVTGQSNETIARAVGRELFGVSVRSPLANRETVFGEIKRRMGAEKAEDYARLMVIYNEVYRRPEEPRIRQKAVRTAVKRAKRKERELAGA